MTAAYKWTHKRLRIKGHRLERWYTGCEDTYGKGRCECGEWSFSGWTSGISAVIASHNSHLNKIKEAKHNAGIVPQHDDHLRVYRAFRIAQS